jgi:hypothetical protein
MSVTWIAAAVVGLIALIETVGRLPTYYRRRTAASCADAVPSLAGMPEGSILFMKANRTGHVFRFVKGADTGEREQRVTFRFPVPPEKCPPIEHAIAALVRAGIPHASRREPWGVMTLEVDLEGEPLSLGRDARALLDALLPGVGFGPQDRYTFHLKGGFDPDLNARVNIDMWRVAANSESGLVRALATRKLKRAAKARRGQ